jgi:hypothetical protein
MALPDWNVSDVVVPAEQAANDACEQISTLGDSKSGQMWMMCNAGNMLEAVSFFPIALY